MIHVFKIMNDMDRLDPHNFFTFPPNNNTRGHSKKKYPWDDAGLIWGEGFLVKRTIHDWNYLPEHVISCAS